MEFAGKFETHVTLRLDGTTDLALLQNWARAHGLKVLHIVLARGRHVSQPMLTRRGHGTLSSELEIARNLCQSLEKAGFSVTRLKLEAAWENQDIPQSSAEAIALHAAGHTGYFEQHIKLLLAPDFDSATLTRITEQHTAHLSRNAWRVRADGYAERFVTQRCAGVGRQEAKEQFEALQQALAPLGQQVTKCEAEYVVYDSNQDLDAGWLTLATSVPS